LTFMVSSTYKPEGYTKLTVYGPEIMKSILENPCSVYPGFPTHQISSLHLLKRKINC
jgi:hypothetical protein